jgi:hypothetical protein
MKQFFTLFSALVLTSSAFAQYTQNFEGTVTSGCTVVNNVFKTTTPGEVITGTGSLYSNPPVNGSATRDFSTPYLNINTTSLTVYFNYKLNESLNGQAERTIQIGLEDAGGFTSLTTILMDKNNDPEVSTPFNQTFTVATGRKRLALKMGGSNGAGSVRIIIDDLSASANSVYVGGCNSAPIAVSDNFTTLASIPYSANVTGNDSDPDGEAITAAILTQPLATEGTVSFNSNGDFTFTPAPGFLGGPVSFTYQVTDNGYTPLSSSAATVTINYPELAMLPVQLISFSGSVVSSRVELKWMVAENETGSYFEVEKSVDGRNFTSAAVVFITSKTGTDNYSFNEKTELTGTAYYRLRIVNKNGTTVQSKIVVLKNEKAVNGGNSSLVVAQSSGASVTFNYKALKSGVYNVNVYSVNGARLITTKLNLQEGKNATSLRVDGLASSGVYVLEVINGADRSITKFLK